MGFRVGAGFVAEGLGVRGWGSGTKPGAICRFSGLEVRVNETLTRLVDSGVKVWGLKVMNLDTVGGLGV